MLKAYWDALFKGMCNLHLCNMSNLLGTVKILYFASII